MYHVRLRTITGMLIYFNRVKMFLNDMVLFAKGLTFIQGGFNGLRQVAPKWECLLEKKCGH
jgi:hypothetical protein